MELLFFNTATALR